MFAQRSGSRPPRPAALNALSAGHTTPFDGITMTLPIGALPGTHEARANQLVTRDMIGCDASAETDMSFPFYCPICMMSFRRILNPLCCPQTICEVCARELVESHKRPLVEMITATSGNRSNYPSPILLQNLTTPPNITYVTPRRPARPGSSADVHRVGRLIMDANSDLLPGAATVQPDDESDPATPATPPPGHDQHNEDNWGPLPRRTLPLPPVDLGARCPRAIVTIVNSKIIDVKHATEVGPIGQVSKNVVDHRQPRREERFIPLSPIPCPFCNRPLQLKLAVLPPVISAVIDSASRVTPKKPGVMSGCQSPVAASLFRNPLLPPSPSVLRAQQVAESGLTPTAQARLAERQRLREAPTPHANDLGFTHGTAAVFVMPGSPSFGRSPRALVSLERLALQDEPHLVQGSPTRSERTRFSRHGVAQSAEVPRECAYSKFLAREHDDVSKSLDLRSGISPVKTGDNFEVLRRKMIPLQQLPHLPPPAPLPKDAAKSTRFSNHMHSQPPATTRSSQQQPVQVRAVVQPVVPQRREETSRATSRQLEKKKEDDSWCVIQ